MWETKQLLVHIDFDGRKKNTMEVTEDQQLFGFPHSSKYHLCSAEERNSLKIKHSLFYLYIMCIFVLIFLITKISSSPTLKVE